MAGVGADAGGRATVDVDRIRGLRVHNVVMGVLHAVQGAAVLVLANDFALPVTGTYLGGPPGSGLSEPAVLFEIPTGAAVAAFLFLSALFHALIASPLFFARYRDGLLAGHNYFRWVEYSLSASLMIVLIAQLTGIADIAALLAIFALNAAMILFGWLQEKYEQPGSGGWLPFVFGCLAGIVPWLAIVIYVLAPGSSSDAEPPTFVYAIIASLFVFFNSFALNQWLQYRRVGPWRDYLVGERAYVTLSLVAKSALAWQVFGGTLAG